MSLCCWKALTFYSGLKPVLTFLLEGLRSVFQQELLMLQTEDCFVSMMEYEVNGP